jgi:hypothetical protein
MMLHGYITFTSSHIPDLNSFVSTCTSKYIPVFLFFKKIKIKKKKKPTENRELYPVYPSKMRKVKQRADGNLYSLFQARPSTGPL